MCRFSDAGAAGFDEHSHYPVEHGRSIKVIGYDRVIDHDHTQSMISRWSIIIVDFTPAVGNCPHGRALFLSVAVVTSDTS